ncbi:redoxin domain-containing protein [bacterium]|nr:redoxin domain-containing protein [bacterium]
MSTQETGVESSTPVKARPTLLITGGVLWLMVIAGAVIMMRQQSPDVAEPMLARDVAVAAMNVEPEDSSDEVPAPVRIELPVNRSDNGAQVIDLSELMGQTKPAAEVPLWDTEGIEDFAFTNCDGRTVTKQDLLGKPFAICFVFTKCLGPCPTVTKQLRDLQFQLRDRDFQLVTLTVDPARDTPEVLANYAKLNGADLDKWYFLTGDQTEIYGLIHRSFRMPVQEVTGPNRQEGFEIIHSTNVMLVDANGVVQGKFNAAKDAEMAELRRELKSLSLPVADRNSTPTETPVADGRP